MALATWPVGLPYEPELKALKRASLRLPRATEVEDGPPIMRLEALAGIKKLTYSILFSVAEKATFDAFVQTTLKRGTEHFIMPVPLANSEYVERRCYIENGDVQEEPISGTHERVSFMLCVFVAELSP